MKLNIHIGIRNKSERSREDAGAPVSDQQMRLGLRYPVDRYLVDSSKIEMVNIIDDDIWNPEPALRPEEEIILRKLHEMLQSTADDLKLLSGELAAQRTPATTHASTAPTPLDEEFNEKVHIEEIVNAKFHGNKMIDNGSKPKLILVTNKPEKNAFNNGIQHNASLSNKKPNINNLTKSRTRLVQIDAMSTKNETVDAIKKNNKEAVTYNEFTYQYPTVKEESFVKGLKVQVMPSVNIRSELKEQKVLFIDIEPDPVCTESNLESKHNVAVISVRHEVPVAKPTTMNIPQYSIPSHTTKSPMPKKTARKVTKMATCESSSSTNNISSDPQVNTTRKNTKATSKTLSLSDRNKIYKNPTVKTEPSNRAHRPLDEWKKKLNTVYGQQSASRKNKGPSKSKSFAKRISPKKSDAKPSNGSQPKLNNTQYIPYSQLTLGGVNVSDIEKEISNIPNNSNIPLSPILDRIISSRENSRNNSPRKKGQPGSPRILTTSDENLLQEVIDIEKTVSKTLSKNIEIRVKENNSQKVSSESVHEEANESDSYIDDFEDDKSDKVDNNSDASQINSGVKSTAKASYSGGTDDTEEEHLDTPKNSKNIHNRTFSKIPNLTLKKRVDIFEYVHEINTQESATQSQTTNRISLKETQTSPTNESTNIPVLPIQNNLWPSMDPSKEIEKMFKLEKELIKKIIMDEYGDLLQKSIDKPSTSKDTQDSLSAGLNVNASQKVTQTSPKHAKSVMTSPTRTKTRTTSPFHLALPIDQQTSPMIVVTDDKDIKVETEHESEDGISINLHSPRFSLRLPNTSLEVISNLEICSGSTFNIGQKQDCHPKLSKSRKENITSSTSIDADNSSSEISSLGEIKLKLKRKLKKNRASTSSESSTASSILSVDLNAISVLPLRSEGELSSIHRSKSRNTNVPSKSEGEVSISNK